MLLDKTKREGSPEVQVALVRHGDVQALVTDVVRKVVFGASPDQ